MVAVLTIAVANRPIMAFCGAGEKRFCAVATGGLRRNVRFISRYGPGYPRGLPLPWGRGLNPALRPRSRCGV
jgi:hypothetical protein